MVSYCCYYLTVTTVLIVRVPVRVAVNESLSRLPAVVA